MTPFSGGAAPRAARRAPGRRGLAIPLVAGFCVLAVILIGVTSYIRAGAKRQHKASFQTLKAQFAAQGAIQVALLKFRVLPNEGFEASKQARDGDTSALDVYLSDVGNDDGNVAFTLAPEGATVWTADVLEGTVLNDVELDGHGDWLHVLRLTAEGRVQDGYRTADGAVEERVEQVEKTVQITRQR